MVIKQGEIYWVNLREPIGSEPGYRRPCLVIQNDLLNHSAVKTTVVCILTSNLQRATSPGNVLLESKESGLMRASVVNITQIATVNKSDLVERIGKLSPKRLNQVIHGLHFLVDPYQLEDT